MRTLKLVWRKSPVDSWRTNKNPALGDQPGLAVSRARPVHKGLPDPRVTRGLKDLPDRLVRRERGATLGRKVW